MNRFFVLSIFFILPFLFSGLSVLAKTQKVFSYSFDRLVLEELDEFIRVKIRGVSQTGYPEKPELPVKTVKILVPAGYRVTGIKIEPSRRNDIKLDKPLWPSSHVHPLSVKSGIKKSGLKDKGIYSLKREYPGFRNSYFMQSMAGYNILLMDVYPVQYLPASDKLNFYKKIKIYIDMEEDNNINGQSLLRKNLDDAMRVKNFVDNPEDIFIPDPGSQTEPLYEYVIITDEALKDAEGPYNFQALLKSKIDSGMTGRIETVENIYANFDGSNNADRIRNYIRHSYLNYGTRYVLLGGDADQWPGVIIPAAGFYADAEGYDDYKIPSDMYYGCLDGNFDYNGNGIMGEVGDGPDGGEVDLLAEVFVGRACIDSVSELSNFIKKTLHYDSLDPYEPYLNNVILAGEYLWSSSINGDIWGADHMEELIDGSDAHGIITGGIPVYTNFIKFYEKNNTFDVNEMKLLIKNGIHYINHMGHSNVSYNMKMYRNSIHQLENEDRYFFGYTQGCYAGSFDNRGTWLVTVNDAFLEEMIGSTVGAFAYIGNSRYGWGNNDTTDGPSQRYHRQFYSGRYREGIKELGILNQFSKEQNVGRINDVAMRWCYYELNLFGDPSLKLKSSYSGI